MKYSLGRYVFGLATIATGICALASHNYDQLAAVPHHAFFSYIVATIEILAGLAVLWTRTARAGAVTLGAIYSIFCLLAIPLIIQEPRVYNNYGNFFEQFSFVAGALILYACSGPIAAPRNTRLAQIGRYSFGLCLVSFALEQIFYPNGTITLVPKWLPPGQYFWFVATTVAFALAAIALLTGFKALLASRLTAAMLLSFELLVWLPVLLRDSRSFGFWGEAIETFAIAGIALLVADYLARRLSAAPSAAAQS
ncbi:MAG TPA: hypothetical protein VN881_06265 [Candidatus Acidoferrales bacterium]|jgi:uncharacterized membrane protein YphA (DoxX/SURF4 family)|nr:hypothetical protein [Candidatus Acidoferrales bacterium]